MNTYGSVVSWITFNLTIIKAKTKQIRIYFLIICIFSGKFVVIIPLHSSTVIGLTLKGLLWRNKRKQCLMLQVCLLMLNYNWPAKIVALKWGCLETTLRVLTARWSWEHGQCGVAHLAQSSLRWNFPASCRCTAGIVGLKNWQIREINGLQIN